MREKALLGIRKLISTGFLYIFGANTLNQVLSFLSGIVLVRVLTKSDYGCFSNAFSIYQFFLLASGLGIASGILQLCSENSDSPELSDKIYRFGCSFGIKVNVVLTIVIFLVGAFVPISMEGTNELLIAFCALPIFTLIYEMSIAKLRGDIRAKEYSCANIINVTLYCALSVVGAILYKSKGLIYGRYLAYILTIIVVATKFGVRPYLTNEIIDKKIKKSLFKISFISAVNNGLTTVFNILEVFILGAVLADSTVTASYKVASTIPTALNFVPAAFAVYVYPYFAKHINDKSWVKKNFSLSILELGVTNLFISTILFILAEPMVTIIFGTQYADSVTLFRILVVGYFIGGTFRTLSGNLLVSQRKLTYNTGVAVTGCIISIVANVLLIPNYGSMGAALAHIIVLVITGFLNTGGMFYFLNRECRKSPKII